MVSTVEIQGITLAGQTGQAWEFASGAGAPQQEFLADITVDRALNDLPLNEPVPLTIKGVHFEGPGKRVETDITVNDLYLTRRLDLVLGRKARWFITDIRFFLQNLWVFSDFNKRRPINEFVNIGKGPQKFFNRVAKLTYIPHTMKLKGDNLFLPGNESADKGEFWTALTALQFMMDGYFDTEAGRVSPPGKGDDWKPTTDFAGVIDNNRRLNQFRTNKPWPFVVQKLLSLAHLGMYVDKDGVFRFYNLNPLDFPGNVGGYVGAGVPAFQDARRSRPRKVRVFFRTDQEIRFDYFENVNASGGNGTVERRGSRDVSLNLRNVLILPQDVFDNNESKNYARGSIVTVEKAIELWNQDKDNPPPKIPGKNGQLTNGRLNYNLDFLRRYIMSPALAVLMGKEAFLPNFKRDPLQAARASALYNSYRRVFQIPKAWLELGTNFKLSRTALIDPITGRRAVSPVWMDYYIEYAFRTVLTGRNVKGKSGLNVYAWDNNLRDVTDAKRLPLETGEVGPFKLSWVNRRQGVFRVAQLPDVYGDTARLIPSTFAEDTIPELRLGQNPRLLKYRTSQMPYESTWRFSTVLTCEMNTPNNHKKLFHITYGKEGKQFSNETRTRGAGPDEQVSPDAEGPNQEFLFGSMHAEFAWTDKKSKVSLVDRTVSIEGNKLTNEAVLEDIGRAVLEDIKFRSQDRIIGQFRGPGADADRDRPRGSISSVIIQNVGGRIEAIHDSTNPPTPPPFFNLLPTSTANILYKLEGIQDQ